MPYTIITDFFPLIVCCTPETATAGDADDYLQRVDEFYARKQQMVWLQLIPKKVKNDREQTRRMGLHMRQTRETARELNAAIAFVSESTVLRFMLAGWFLMQPLESPYSCFAGIPEALSWLKHTSAGRVSFDARVNMQSIVDRLPREVVPSWAR